MAPNSCTFSLYIPKSPEQNRVTAKANAHRQSGEDWTCGLPDMRTNRQTDRQTDTLIAIHCSPNGRFVFRMRSTVLLDCSYFILFSLVFPFFLCMGQLLVHFVPCCNFPDCCKLHCMVRLKKGKSSPNSITARRVPRLIPVLGSQPASDVSHKPGGRLPLLSARPAVTPQPLRGLLPILLLGEQKHNGCEQFA